MGPQEILSMHTGMLTDVVIVHGLFRQLFCWEFMVVASLSYLEDNLLLDFSVI